MNLDCLVRQNPVMRNWFPSCFLVSPNLVLYFLTCLKLRVPFSHINYHVFHLQWDVAEDKWILRLLHRTHCYIWWFSLAFRSLCKTLSTDTRSRKLFGNIFNYSSGHPSPINKMSLGSAWASLFLDFVIVCEISLPMHFWCTNHNWV